MSDEPSADEPKAKDLPPPPAASFEGIVEMFASQAIASMGLMPGAPEEPRLDYSKYFIDLLEVLEQKTKGSISEEEAKRLEQTLHYLRMAFVEVNKSK